MSYADFKRAEIIATKFIIRKINARGSLGITLDCGLVDVMGIKPNDYFIPRLTRQKNDNKLILEYITKKEAEKRILEGW